MQTFFTSHSITNGTRAAAAASISPGTVRESIEKVEHLFEFKLPTHDETTESKSILSVSFELSIAAYRYKHSNTRMK